VPTFRTGTVTAVRSERPGLQRVDTDLGRAYVLTDLTGLVATGDRPDAVFKCPPFAPEGWPKNRLVEWQPRARIGLFCHRRDECAARGASQPEPSSL
jgi:hypothetical protein